MAGKRWSFAYCPDVSSKENYMIIDSTFDFQRFKTNIRFSYVSLLRFRDFYKHNN